MRSFNRLSIQSKLMSMLLAVSIGSIVVIAYEGYRSGQSALADSFEKQLTGLRSAKAGQIEDYFRTLRNEVQVYGRNPSTIEAMKSFIAGYDSVLGESDAIDAERVNGLRSFYRDEFAPALIDRTGSAVDSDIYLPSSIVSRYLQSEYIVQNPNPIGEKEEFDGPIETASGDDTAYNRAHRQYHPIFKEAIKELGYYDLFLISNQGNIVYSVEKETDFATSLTFGTTPNSNLAAAYKDAQRQNSGYVTMVDFEFYVPSYNSPAAFMATPIYDGIELIGVLAIQLSVDEINRVMTGNQRWHDDGLGETGETFLVGEDLTMRSDSRVRLEDPDAYFAALAEPLQGGITTDQTDAAQTNRKQSERIRQVETAILTQTVNHEGIATAQAGQSGIDTVTNYLGKAVLSAYAPLDIRGVDWVIVSEIEEAEIFAPITVFARRVLISAAGLVFLITLASLWLASAFLRPVSKLTEGFCRIAQGDEAVSVEISADDELGELGRAFNHMVKKNRTTSALVLQKTQETEALLLNMFPATVAKRLRKGQTLIADEAENVTVIFVNVFNFQRLIETLKPTKAVEILNELVKALDESTKRYGVEKIKTTGSEYLAVSGLSIPRLDHTKRVIDFAIESIQIAAQINREWETDLKVRVGIHSGSVIAGTVGSQRLIYDLWGDTVATAYYVQAVAEPNSIYVSESVAASLGDLYKFEPMPSIQTRQKHLPIFRVEPQTQES
ncbi:MAG: adenylate/guanylate cyclase domain-containing protein [Cyanobacteria bacterium P01_D01_bin.1]